MKTTTTCTSCGCAIPETPLNHEDYGPARCVACRYSKPGSIGDDPFFDSSPVNDPEFEAAAVGMATTTTGNTSSEGDPLRGEAFNKWLYWLVGTGNPTIAGARVIVTAHVLSKTGTADDAALAVKLKISRGRVSQYRREIIERFGRVGRCNNRQA